MKKTIPMVIAALTALCLFATTPAAFAGNGNGPGDGTGPLYTISDGVAVEVSGIVTVIGTPGSGLGIDNGTEIVTVYGIGPVSFWEAAGVDRPEVGEAIIVKGYEIALSDGTFKIIAASVTIGDEELVLRDPETSAPLWRGQKGKKNGNGNGGGNGKGNRTGDCRLSAIDQSSMLLAKGGHGNGGHGPGDGTGNGGNGPKDGSGHGNKSGTCPNA